MKNKYQNTLGRLLGGQKTCEVCDGGVGDRVDNRDDRLIGDDDDFEDVEMKAPQT